jgi:cytochrome b
MTDSVKHIIRVWDPLVRIFHWSLATAFLIAYITEDDFMTLHEYSGYLILGLIGFRIVWGLIGTQYARFSDFVKPPKAVIQYLKDIASFKANRYIGHNPAGGAMVIALLLSLLLTGITGMLYFGLEDQQGLLASHVANWPSYLNDPLEEIHEFFANLTLLLVILHIAGVLLASVQHGENLIRSMLNGNKDSNV